MRILGIDPGYAIIGWGVLDYEKNKFSVVEYGAITTPAGMPFPQRIELIYDEISAILARLKPEALSMEKLFFTTNKTTGIDVAQARGAILLAIAQSGVPYYEYSPAEVKAAVVGYGKAEKRQMMELTRIQLGLSAIPKPDDAADALALALCHARSSASLMNRI